MGGLKYLLDTNIISEPARVNPNQAVLEALQRCDETWCTCAIVWRELYYGIERMPDSRKKAHIAVYLRQLEESSLQILPFDTQAARWLATEQVRLERQGKTPSYADSEIASIAVTQGLTLVTRNTSDFLNFNRLLVENWFSD